VLSQIDTFTGTLDTNKGQIVDAIEALNRLALSAHQQEGNIDEALDELPSALTSIDGQRADLVRMLQALDQLSNVGVRVIKASKTATIDSLRQLQPVLNQLAASGDNFVKAFNVFLTYPFVDEVVGRDPQVARNLHMGDYTNLSIDLDIDLTKGLALPTALPTDLPGEVIGAVQACLTHVAQGGALTDPVCADLVGTKVLQVYCAKHPEQQICTLIAIIPGLPGLPGGLLGGGSAPQGGAAAPSSGASSGVLGGLLGGLGLGRSATGPWNDAAHGGPTMGQLQAAYDPSLVSLLVPELVVPTQQTTQQTTPGGGGS
jgi:phospholipid/cholesterol/gamma-HCH transport system substrate-binding protein